MGRIIRNILNRYALLLFILLTWEVSSRLIAAKDSMQNIQVLFLSLSAVIKEAVTLFRERIIIMHILASLRRVLVGFGVLALFAVPLGVSVSLSKRWGRQLKPVIRCLLFIPPVAWIPISILWFGIGELRQYYIIFIGTFASIFTIVYNYAKEIPELIKRTALCLGASKLKILLKVTIPATLKGILLALRLGLGFAWYLNVASEFVSTPNGLGYLIFKGRGIIKTEIIFVGMIIIGLISYFFNSILLRINCLILPWTRKEDEISGIFESQYSL